MVSNQEIKDAFKSKIDLRKKVEECAKQETKARSELKFAETVILNENRADPKALGGNDKTRDAAIREKTETEHAALEEAESKKRDAALDYEIAGYELECLTWQIRNEQASADLQFTGLTLI